jgi:hypothetical protein
MDAPIAIKGRKTGRDETLSWRGEVKMIRAPTPMVMAPRIIGKYPACILSGVPIGYWNAPKKKNAPVATSNTPLMISRGFT